MSLNVPPVQVEAGSVAEGVDIGPDNNVYPRKNRAGKLFLYNRATNKYDEFNPITAQP